ncbi:glycosyl hydrolase-related protein [Cohnella yongneupensis]|uniref:Glycosyl hydrolase-related protein n=1 Tax=Cohnella yongneupensis TaxID=425006 RepID=A0ABW0R0C5_9BACL
MSNIKEILVYHHSHLDVGYTHPQPVLWELQNTYIDQAIDLCEATSGEAPDNRFYWTCEATSPVLNWLEQADERQVARFEKLVRSGQICLTATYMHSTPLCSAEEIARSLYPVKALRERFGVPIRTAINHDINGQPWMFGQLMIDAGVELYTTGINTHFGGIPIPRPQAFHWEAPNKKKLLTFHGEHYSLFTQFGELWDEDMGKMQAGLQRYMDHLAKQNYGYDFIYLSATNSPMLDNTPPDQHLLAMIRKWNEDNLGPKIRMVTPEMLLERLKRLPSEQVPTYAGDWTDFWNFGAASSADETRLSRRTKTSLQSAEFVAAFRGPLSQREAKAYGEAWEQVQLYDEHTWGANISISQPNAQYTKVLWGHKAHYAFLANSLSGYLLNRELETLSGNPLQSGPPEGVLLVNPSGFPQSVDVRAGDDWFHGGRHTSAARFHLHKNNGDTDWTMPSRGTVELKPFSYKIVPLANSTAKAADADIRIEDGLIDTPFYTLTYDGNTGRLLGLVDKKTSWQMIDTSSEWTLFQYVRETPNPLHQRSHRESLFHRDVDSCNYSISCWKRDWTADRRGAEKLISLQADRHDSGVTLSLVWQAPGVERLEQRITLFGNKPGIEMIAVLDKKDEKAPESIYFALPLKLSAGWEAVYDSADALVRLDKDQLPGVSRDWVTVDRAVSVFDGKHGVTLACPDAPLVQIGDFNFGKESKEIPRNENPLLLAWPLNNYWDTNFKATQPGQLTLKYVLYPFGNFDPIEMIGRGAEASLPVQMFPAIHCKAEKEGTLLEVSGHGVVTSYVKPAENGDGLIVRLHNPTALETTFSIGLPGVALKGASSANLLEESIEELDVSGGQALGRLASGEWATIRIRA